MRAEEIREMATEDIAARVRDLEEERFRLRFRSATESLEDPLRLRVIRKDVARLNTVLRERERGVTVTPSAGKAPRAKSKKPAAKKGTRGGRKTSSARGAR
jgi:large subunit ribosomal protein L29